MKKDEITRDLIQSRFHMYRAGKRDGAAQARREIIKAISYEMNTMRRELTVDQVLDIIEQRPQQQDTNVPLPQQEET